MSKYTKETIQKVRNLKETGRTFEEIAKEAGVPMGSISSLLSRPMRKPRTKTVRKPKGPIEAIRAILKSPISDTEKLVVIDVLAWACT